MANYQYCLKCTQHDLEIDHLLEMFDAPQDLRKEYLDVQALKARINELEIQVDANRFDTQTMWDQNEKELVAVKAEREKLNAKVDQLVLKATCAESEKQHLKDQVNAANAKLAKVEAEKKVLEDTVIASQETIMEIESFTGIVYKERDECLEAKEKAAKYYRNEIEKLTSKIGELELENESFKNNKEKAEREFERLSQEFDHMDRINLAFRVENEELKDRLAEMEALKSQRGLDLEFSCQELEWKNMDIMKSLSDTEKENSLLLKDMKQLREDSEKEVAVTKARCESLKTNNSDLEAEIQLLRDQFAAMMQENVILKTGIVEGHNSAMEWMQKERMQTEQLLMVQAASIQQMQEIKTLTAELNIQKEKEREVVAKEVAKATQKAKEEYNANIEATMVLVRQVAAENLRVNAAIPQMQFMYQLDVQRMNGELKMAEKKYQDQAASQRTILEKILADLQLQKAAQDNISDMMERFLSYQEHADYSDEDEEEEEYDEEKAEVEVKKQEGDKDDAEKLLQSLVDAVHISSAEEQDEQKSETSKSFEVVGYSDDDSSFASVLSYGDDDSF